jgi:hypothetical protein
MNIVYRHPILTSLAVTPVFLAFAALSGGVGHGSYIAAVILFPFAALSVIALDHFLDATVPMIFIATIQFPIYGILLWLGQGKMHDRNVILSLLALHTVAVMLALLVVYYP